MQIAYKVTKIDRDLDGELLVDAVATLRGFCPKCNSLRFTVKNGEYADCKCLNTTIILPLQKLVPLGQPGETLLDMVEAAIGDTLVERLGELPDGGSLLCEGWPNG